MKYCRECGKEIVDNAVFCVHCGCATNAKPSPAPFSEGGFSFDTSANKWVALLLWFFLGCFGAHRFYVQDIRGGILYLLANTIGAVLLIPPLIAFVFWIIDLVRILNGSLNGVELKG